MTTTHWQTRYLTPGRCWNISIFQPSEGGEEDKILFVSNGCCVKFPRWDHCNQNLRLVLGRRYKERGTTAERTETIFLDIDKLSISRNQFTEFYTYFSAR